jgi:hypothetical protein
MFKELAPVLSHRVVLMTITFVRDMGELGPSGA